jgi:hypothetical protein
VNSAQTWSPRRFSKVQPDDDIGPFFEATARGRLALPRCANGHWLGPDTPRCPECGSTDLRWCDTAGQGWLVSWTVIHGRPTADGSSRPVATVAIAELDEGPWITGPLRVRDGRNLQAGTRLLVGFDSGEDETIPFFFLGESTKLWSRSE